VVKKWGKEFLQNGPQGEVVLPWIVLSPGATTQGGLVHWGHFGGKEVAGEGSIKASKRKFRSGSHRRNPRWKVKRRPRFHWEAHERGYRGDIRGRRFVNKNSQIGRVRAQKSRNLLSRDTS